MNVIKPKKRSILKRILRYFFLKPIIILSIKYEYNVSLKSANQLYNIWKATKSN